MTEALLVTRTARFDIFLVTVRRCHKLGEPRDVYMAWPHSEDVPRSVCEVTLFGSYVEWVHVCEQHRRQGIATEVLTALERHLGVLDKDGVTESGDAFLDSYELETTT